MGAVVLCAVFPTAVLMIYVGWFCIFKIHKNEPAPNWYSYPNFDPWPGECIGQADEKTTPSLWQGWVGAPVLFQRGKLRGKWCFMNWSDWIWGVFKKCLVYFRVVRGTSFSELGKPDMFNSAGLPFKSTLSTEYNENYNIYIYIHIHYTLDVITYSDNSRS